MNKTQMQKFVKKAYVQMQIQELLPAQEYQIFIKPNFASATWQFHQGKHKIVIGENVLKYMDKNSTPQGKLRYLRSFLYHELAHSLWTEKDLESTKRHLATECISFELYNLFEDARIEEKMRKYTNQGFVWTQYENIELPKNAIEIFFYILQFEHQQKALKYLKEKMKYRLEDDLNAVFHYYKRVLSARNLKELIPIMIDWYNDFPITESYLEPFKEKAYLFSVESGFSKDKDTFEELISGLEDVLSEDRQDLFIIKRDPRTIVHSQSIQGKGTDLLSETPQTYNINANEEHLLYTKISSLFDKQTMGKYSNSSTVSKRLNIRGLVQKSQKKFKKKTILKASVPLITLIVDMSGSMLDIVDNMQMVLKVINKLASKQIIKCELILSAVVYSESQFQNFTLPVEGSIINRMYPNYGGEGLDFTMKSNLAKLKKSDYVWILTDGCITSDNLDKTYYNRFGIKTHAFYIGDTSYTQTMQDYFDHVICEEDAKGLINEILTLIK